MKIHFCQIEKERKENSIIFIVLCKRNGREKYKRKIVLKKTRKIAAIKDKKNSLIVFFLPKNKHKSKTREIFYIFA